MSPGPPRQTSLQPSQVPPRLGLRSAAPAPSSPDPLSSSSPTTDPFLTSSFFFDALSESGLRLEIGFCIAELSINHVFERHQSGSLIEFEIDELSLGSLIDFSLMKSSEIVFDQTPSLIKLKIDDRSTDHPAVSCI